MFCLQGEPGQAAMRSFCDSAKAIADFKRKFKDKTKNAWEDREQFQAVSGKYTLIEMGSDEEEQAVPAVKVSFVDFHICDYKMKCTYMKLTASVSFEHDTLNKYLRVLIIWYLIICTAVLDHFI